MSHLRQNPLFRGLSDEELTQVLTVSRVMDLRDGQTIFSQGDPSEHVCIVRRGFIRIFAVHDGVEETYTTLSMGAVFGEIGVLKNQARTATAVAQGEASILVFKGDDFQALIERHPAIAQIVRQTMFSRFKNDANRAERRKARAQGAALFPIFSATGGAGTTLVTANLAGHVQELTKKRVLVLDLDLMFGDQGAVLGADSGLTLSDIAMQETISAEDVLQLIQKSESGVDVLRAPVQPEQAEFLGAELVNICLDHLMGHYDFIFCDTSCELREISLELFERAYVPLYVLTPDLTSIRNAMRWLDVVGRIGLEVGTTRFIVNRVDAADRTSVEYVEQRLGDRLLERLPFEPATASKSLNSAKLLDQVDPSGSLNQSVRRTAGKLVGLEIATEDPAGKSFWKRWM